MYNKIFAKILDSSIWLEDVSTRIVWVTFLASMDQDGYAHFSAIANLANRARVTLDEATSAINILSSPDPDSADPDFEGKRIERIPGGFLILNAEKYRNIVTRIVQREQTKKRVAKHRQKNKCNANVTQGNTLVTPSEADTYTYTDKQAKPVVQYPEELNKKAWDEYIAYRKEAGLRKLRNSSEVKQIEKIIGFGDKSVQQQCIDETISNGWQGVFPPKSSTGKNSGERFMSNLRDLGRN